MAHITAREAAFLAVLAASQEEKFIADSLEEWRRKEHPSEPDDRLAQEIANGSCRMALLMDTYAQQLNPTGRLSLKRKEKALLRTALYQFALLERIPSFAIADESIKIGKKYCHPSFVSFLNMLLRKASVQPLDPPKEISLRYSYPKWFVKQLFKEHGEVEGEALLAYGNHPSPLTIRIRPGVVDAELETRNLKIFSQEPRFAWILSKKDVTQLSVWPGGYIQNWTPANLMGKLHRNQNPQTILDLCSAPGGKLILAHDIFPQAKLWANDVSLDKLAKVKENLNKYGLEALLTKQKGEEWRGDQKFDLIIIDAPCSNTGVLNKRPEARWRLSEETVKAHAELQRKLILHAKSLLNEGGEIWYMTCSILKEENAEVAHSVGMKVNAEVLVLLNGVEKDGGYGVSLTID